MNTTSTQKTYKGKTFEAIIITDTTPNYGLSNRGVREIGSQVFIHFIEEDEVLVYAPCVRVKGKIVKAVLDTIMSVEEAKKYIKCTKATDRDIYREWSKVMSDRYF